MGFESAFPVRIRALPPVPQGTTTPVAGVREKAWALNAPGCKVLFVATPAGTVLPPHTHDTENVTLIVSGEAIVTTDEGEFRCGPGQWYHTDPGQKHGIRSDVDTLQVELAFDAES
jgi:quercetin dioxygenase-like cupin family protein